MRRSTEINDLFPIVLVGLPGAGKTSVGRCLADFLNVALIDSDSEIKRRARCGIPELFKRVGESGFRELEYRAIEQSLSQARGIVALGGGAVTYPRTRELLRRYVVVYLRSSVDEIVSRIGDISGRPLLDGDVKSRLIKLNENRANLYESVANITINTDGANIEDVSYRIYCALKDTLKNHNSTPANCEFEEKLLKQSQPTRIHVGSNPGYDVVVGNGVSKLIRIILPAECKRVFVLHPPTLRKQVTDICDSLDSYQVFTMEHPDGEAAKTADIAIRCWQQLGEAKLTRKDAVIGFGGGATTDLAGFVGATWLRGVNVIQVPTTLLAMVDAAVGGKTGINTETGKNLVGAFYPPSAVIADIDMLNTLPQSFITAGMAEIVKCGWIRDPQILSLVRGGGELTINHQHLLPLIERAVQVKAEVVSADLYESGLREILNYGHTAAHAIEKLSNYSVGHGCAVAIGMVFAADVAQQLGLAETSMLEQQITLLQELGLPISWKTDIPAQAAIEVMRSDKKVRGDSIRMVFVTRVGETQVRPVTDMEVLSRAWESICR